MSKNNIIASLDIGETKIVALISEVIEDKIHIIGVGMSPSLGLEKMIVTDMELLTNSIKEAVGEAEELAEVEVDSVFLGVAGNKVRGIKSRGVITLPPPGREISASDVAKAIRGARVVSSSSGHETLQEIVQEFIVDGQGGVKNPVGMYGLRLETDVFIVRDESTSTNSSQTIIECAEGAGLEIEDTIFGPLAASEAVLTAGEKKLGTLLVDIGAHRVGVVVFDNGAVKSARILNTGAGEITDDIAKEFHISLSCAEQLKRGNLSLPPSADKKGMIDIPVDGDMEKRRISRHTLHKVIYERIKKIFSQIIREVDLGPRSSELKQGIVLTGGGALLSGIGAVAQERFRLIPRIGKPSGVVGDRGRLLDSPAYSVAVGILHCGLRKRQLHEVLGGNVRNPFLRLGKRFRDFF